MNDSILKLKLKQSLECLEKNDDIIITDSNSELVIAYLYRNIVDTVTLNLSEHEYHAITNALNVLICDIKLDDNDFQTIIGMSKDKLEVVLHKLLLSKKINDKS